MKKIMLVLAAVFCLMLSACKPAVNTIIAGRYLPEGYETTEDMEKSLGLFIRTDGSFYLNCSRSFNYHPSGKFTLKNGVLTLVDNYGTTIAIFNMIDKEHMVYVAEGSDYGVADIATYDDRSFGIRDGMVFVWHEDKNQKK